ncbi:DUF4430 domain-containing protein [Bacillus sp. AGMB 02131]|uniref:DUF4430 domain-containing protein n=1 Tax=Peribacillus faecalis TaxID=2772559 RepID=A0A927CTR5_9BACI|nr:DUF4430 domain-containing protein [Peribacillus faecalis]MBD3107398.1 DUF4430 domain-containing protein [Peribacillus faecalis]
MRKDLLSLAFVILLIVIIASGTKIQSVDEYYLTHADDITEDSETVALTIRSDTILDHFDQLKPELREFVPEDGIILAKTDYVLRPGDTVFDILHRAVRHHKIQMEFQGADANVYNSVYIQGINYLYEFSCGPLSGWMYKVNGEFPLYGVSQYELEDGDIIEFHYTCDFGRDLGYEF